jgi:uncharacterized protein (TIGR00266 family)
MAAMSAGVSVSAGLGPGGVTKAVLRKQLGGESFFMTRYASSIHGAWVALAPKYPGDVEHSTLDGDSALLIQSGSLLAVSSGVSVDVRWAGMRSIAMREGSMLLRVAGTGNVLMSSYGGIQRFELADGEQMIVDTSHLVAFSEDISFKIGPLGGVGVAALSGEGIVAKLTGPGLVYIQTRAETGLRGWLFPQSDQKRGRE